MNYGLAFLIFSNAEMASAVKRKFNKVKNHLLKDSDISKAAVIDRRTNSELLHDDDE